MDAIEKFEVARMTLRSEIPMPVQGAKRPPRRRRTHGARPSACETADQRRERIVQIAWRCFSRRATTTSRSTRSSPSSAARKRRSMLGSAAKRACSKPSLGRDAMTSFWQSILTLRQSGGAADRNRSLIPAGGSVAADTRISPADGFDWPDLSGDRTVVLSDRTCLRLQHRCRVDREAAKRRTDWREDPDRLAVLFLDMLIGEHQLSALTGAARPSHEKIDETVRLAVKVFLRGCASSGQLG